MKKPLSVVWDGGKVTTREAGCLEDFVSSLSDGSSSFISGLLPRRGEDDRGANSSRSSLGPPGVASRDDEGGEDDQIPDSASAPNVRPKTEELEDDDRGSDAKRMDELDVEGRDDFP